MTINFRSYNVIYIVYARKNENHWLLLITRTRNTNIYLRGSLQVLVATWSEHSANEHCKIDYCDIDIYIMR